MQACGALQTDHKYPRCYEFDGSGTSVSSEFAILTTASTKLLWRVMIALPAKAFALSEAEPFIPKIRFSSSSGVGKIVYNVLKAKEFLNTQPK